MRLSDARAISSHILFLFFVGFLFGLLSHALYAENFTLFPRLGNDFLSCLSGKLQDKSGKNEIMYGQVS